jgi:two-component system, LytTR family, response regulator
LAQCINKELRMQVLIVDDEPLSRTLLRQLLRSEADVEVVGECENGVDAVKAVRELEPDVVFLDVEMPEMDGFQVLDGLQGGRIPLIVFVTAFDEYAVRAFEVLALDYVLKPVSPERLTAACARARSQLAKQRLAGADDGLLKLLAQLRNEGGTRQLFVRTANKVVMVDRADVKFMEAAGNYVNIHATSSTYKVRQTLAEMEGLVDRTFARIHRSTIVNLRHVKEFQPWFSGEMLVLMRDGTKLKLSRHYRQEFEARHRILS